MLQDARILHSSRELAFAGTDKLEAVLVENLDVRRVSLAPERRGELARGIQVARPDGVRQHPGGDRGKVLTRLKHRLAEGGAARVNIDQGRYRHERDDNGHDAKG